MSWQNEMVRIVRFLINDIDASSYTDERLEETILVAAQSVYASIDFPNTYTIDVDTLVWHIHLYMKMGAAVFFPERMAKIVVSR